MSLTVLLADDHKIVRDGLRSLLEKEPGLAVLAEAEDGREAVRLTGELQPDVVIMDIGMPGLNGIEATRQIKARYPRGQGGGPVHARRQALRAAHDSRPAPRAICSRTRQARSWLHAVRKAADGPGLSQPRDRRGGGGEPGDPGRHPA